MTEKGTKNWMGSKLYDYTPMPFLNTPIKEGIRICKICHNMLNYIEESIIYPNCRGVFKHKNGSADFYDKYKRINLNCAFVTDQFERNIAQAGPRIW